MEVVRRYMGPDFGLTQAEIAEMEEKINKDKSSKEPTKVSDLNEEDLDDIYHKSIPDAEYRAPNTKNPRDESETVDLTDKPEEETVKSEEEPIE